MNKLIIFISLGLMVVGCSKSSPNPNKTTIVLTGKYVSYREVDTLYNALMVADGINVISIYSAYGDTIRYNPGTASATTDYNFPDNNTAAEGRDSLTFTSISTAIKTEPSFVPVTINYNLNAGTFSDGSYDERERIVAVDANTVELITSEIMVDGQPNTIGGPTAIYYRKL